MVKKGSHTGTQNARFRQGFYHDCQIWATGMDYLLNNRGKGRLDWVGNVGVMGHCSTSSFSWHHSARGFDISRIDATSSWFVDTNWSWRQGPGHIRRYVAVAAVTRYYFKNTLTAWYNSDHHNHIHFDNGRPIAPINTERADTVLIQAACKYIDGADLAIDGVWGTKTNRSVKRLRDKIAPTATNIRGNLDSTRYLLTRIAALGISNITV